MKEEHTMKNVSRAYIQLVADGQTGITGEAVRIARAIIERNLFAQFRRYAAKYEGAEESEEDFNDCLIDYEWNGRELTLALPKGYRVRGWTQIKMSGMTIVESFVRLVSNLYELKARQPKFLERLQGCEFTFNGRRGHYILDMGVIEQLVRYGQLSEERDIEFALKKMKIAAKAA